MSCSNQRGILRHLLFDFFFFLCWVEMPLHNTSDHCIVILFHICVISLLCNNTFIEHTHFVQKIYYRKLFLQCFMWYTMILILCLHADVSNVTLQKTIDPILISYILYSLTWCGAMQHESDALFYFWHTLVLLLTWRTNLRNFELVATSDLKWSESRVIFWFVCLS